MEVSRFPRNTKESISLMAADERSASGTLGRMGSMNAQWAVLGARIDPAAQYFDFGRGERFVRRGRRQFEGARRRMANGSRVLTSV